MALLAALLFAGGAAAASAGAASSIFQFTDLVKVDGTPISLAQFKGNVSRRAAGRWLPLCLSVPAPTVA